MSDIPALTSAAQRLSEKVDFWNWAIVAAMIFAAFAATVLVTFQTIAFKRAKQLSDIQNSLLSDANQSTEKLRQRNLQLEKLLSPRVLAIRGLPDGKSNIDELKKFAGTKIILVSIHDAEALHAAGSIKWFLEKAGWNVVVTVPIDPFSASVRIPDGVTLIRAREGDTGRNEQLAKVFMTVLMDQGWREVRLEQDTVGDWKEFEVLVGFKPPAYELLK